MIDLTSLLRILAEEGGSDLHLKVGVPPTIRVDGELRRLPGNRLTNAETTSAAQEILPSERREKLERQNEVDFAYSVAGVGRFRVNVFRQRGSISLVFRWVRVGSPCFDELGLPPIVRQLADAPRGLILVTGATGSGKTTTLAAMIDYINSRKPVHILTIEDPIEVVHPDRMATVNQRELGVDTDDYAKAMRAAMRQDPDVILIGEMRDPETVSAALAAGETGHLVLSTLHTTNSVETVNRIVDFFPSYQQHQVRITLASALLGVICQRLMPRAGGGRIPAMEVLVNNGRVADRIIDPQRTWEILQIIGEGEYYGHDDVRPIAADDGSGRAGGGGRCRPRRHQRSRLRPDARTGRHPHPGVTRGRDARLRSVAAPSASRLVFHHAAPRPSVGCVEHTSIEPEADMRVTVVGSGFVGATAAMRVAQKGLADEVVMIDIVEGLPQGLALDMRESAPIEGFEPNVVGTNDYADTAESDVVVITAGLPRQPGMSRMDLLEKNAGIIRDAVGRVAEHSPEAILIVVTNPLDEMTFLASEVSGFPKERVMGMAGVLDSSRLRYFVAEELGVSPATVEAMTLGSHGESMVPLPGRATVQGRALKGMVADETLERLYQRTRDAGAEIVGLLKKGSAYYAPSAAIAQMVNAIAGDTKEVLPVCAWCTGQYGIDGVYVGVPARLGRKGVEEIVEFDLEPSERDALRQAAEGIRAKCADLPKAG